MLYGETVGGFKFELLVTMPGCAIEEQKDVAEA